ncbi:MAG: polysaccharide deacetylase family protein [Bacteroides sp.]
MINLSPPRSLSRLFRNITWYVDNAPRTIYLTFDDGPMPGITDWVLDLLASYNARATFFCLGRNAERYPELIQRQRDEGHTVGNHTYSHLRGFDVSKNEYFRDVLIANDLLQSDLFRPPYARIRPSQYRALQPYFKLVLWSVLSMDYSRWISPVRCAEFLFKNLHGGDIVVFHDSYKAEGNLRYALPLCLEHFTALGFQFSPLQSSMCLPITTQSISESELQTSFYPAIY